VYSANESLDRAWQEHPDSEASGRVKHHKHLFQ
jgi:hypothetical protein